jgi:hypothetical protein
VYRKICVLLYYITDMILANFTDSPKEEVD